MKRLLALLIAGLFAINFIACSSSTESEEEVIEFDVLVNYLEGSNGDYINTDAPALLAADAVYNPAGGGVISSIKKVIDLRDTTAFGTGHIKDAVNTTLGDILTEVASMSKTDSILVVCKTGQSAGHAILALRLLGYENTFSLKFGMSSWNVVFDNWSNNTSSAYTSDFTTTATDLNAVNTYPTLNTGIETGAEILASRINTMLAGGFKAITAGTVVAAKENYYILNYFGETDYLGGAKCPPGHIEGAYQYTPTSSLKTTEQLKNLPTDKTIVVYCWTGQHSSQVASFLNILGYDAVSLKFGVNGMIYDQLGDTAPKWTESNNYPYF
jgi:rhodanese-related sulfurtransferase